MVEESKHLAAVTGRADTRCSVDADTHVALLSHLGLSRVQTHAHLDFRSFGPALRGQVALRIHGCCHGVGSGAEGDEEGVALGVHHPSIVGGEGRAQQARVLGQQLRRSGHGPAASGALSSPRCR